MAEKNNNEELDLEIDDLDFENIKDNLKLCTNEELQLIDGIIRCILENRNGEKI